MPKFITFLDKIDETDRLEIGQKATSFAFLNQIGAKLPKGFVILPKMWLSEFEKFTSQIILNSQAQNKIADKGAFYKDLAKLVTKNLDISSEKWQQILSATKPLKFPLVLEVVSKRENTSELVTFETMIFSKPEIIPNIKAGLTSFLNPAILPEISFETLKNLEITILVAEKPVAEISGKVVVVRNKSPKIRIYAQWGQYHPNWTSDLIVLDLLKLTEEEYNTALQEKQVILKNAKYISIPVAKTFQFTKKLDEMEIHKLASLAKKLSNSLFSDFEFRFSISDNQFYITNLSANESHYKPSERLPLIDYLELYKQLKPLVRGIKTGPIRKILNKKDLTKIQTGEIAAIKYFDKKVIPSLKKASGIVLDHSKKLTAEQITLLKKTGKTTLVGNLDKLRNRVVTIDGQTGKVYLGSFQPPYTKTLAPISQDPVQPVLKHATALFSKISSQKEAEESTTAEISGYLFEYKDNIGKVILELGPLHKPMILTCKETAIQEAISLVNKLRHKSGLTNLHFCIPAAITYENFSNFKKIVSAEGLHRGGSFKLFCTVANPSTALNIAQFLEEGIDGILIDYYSLVNKTYGKEFSLTELNQLEETSIEILLNQVLNLSKNFKLYTLVSNLPEGRQNIVLPTLIRKGLKAIVSDPAATKQTEANLAQIEKNLFNQVS